MKFRYRHSNAEEGVADKIYNKIGIPDEFEKFETKYVKKTSDNKLFGIMKKRWDNTYFKEQVPIFKNPNTITGFLPGVRGIIMQNGDLYLGNASYFLHQDLIPYLVSRDIIKDDKNIINYWYQESPQDDEFISVQLFNGKIYLGESHDADIIRANRAFVKDILKKCKEKNPNLIFEFVKVTSVSRGWLDEGDLDVDPVVKVEDEWDRQMRERIEKLQKAGKISYASLESLEEGVADKYYEKNFHITDDKLEKFEKDFLSSKIEKPICYIKTPVYKIPVFKNPSSLNHFDDNVRAISTISGDLYVCLYDGYFNHNDLANALKDNHIIDFELDKTKNKNIAFYLLQNEFLLLVRDGHNNGFIESESFNRTKNSKLLLDRVSEKNPQFKFRITENLYENFFENELGRPVAYVNKTPIYENPKSLELFDDNVRAIATDRGYLYVALKDKDFNHGEMANALAKKGEIICDLYDSKYGQRMGIYDEQDCFLLLNRLEDTNEFILSDMFVHQGRNTIKMIEKLKQRNPQFTYLDHIKDVEN